MTPKKTSDFRLLSNDNDFKNEVELRDYIIMNKEVFCREILGVEYKEHVIEFAFPIIEGITHSSIRVDIIFTDINNSHHLIELKNPKNGFNELMQGIGQCLAYKYLAAVLKINYGSINLITSKHCVITPLLIRENDLKINYIYFDKTKSAIAGEFVRYV